MEQVVTKTDGTEHVEAIKEIVELNDNRKTETLQAANTLYTSHFFMADLNTIVHYIDNALITEQSVMAKLVPSQSRMSSGIVHYLYKHRGNIGALVFVNGSFSAHLFHGEEPKGGKYLSDIFHPNSDETACYTETQLERFCSFFLDDDESKMVHIDIAPGMYDSIEKALAAAGQQGDEAKAGTDAYIFDGLFPSIEAITALISEKEIETTFNKYKRIKRIDPYLTICYVDANQEEVREKLKVTLETFAVSEEQQRYVINATAFSLNEILMYRNVLLEDKPIDDPSAEGFNRVYDAKMISLLAKATEHGYVLGVIETRNGNFNINYDGGVYVGYTYKQSINSPNSYVVLMNKEDPSIGFENILIIYNDFGYSFTQPLSRENAEIVFKQLVNIRPNLHEDYIDKREVRDVKEVHPRGEHPAVTILDESPFQEVITDGLRDDASSDE